MGLVSKEIVVLRLWEIKVYTVIPNDENLQALEHFPTNLMLRNLALKHYSV